MILNNELRRMYEGAAVLRYILTDIGCKSFIKRQNCTFKP